MTKKTTVHAAAVALGRRGGRAGRGRAKARSRAQARRAGALGAAARWKRIFRAVWITERQPDGTIRKRLTRRLVWPARGGSR